MSVHKIISGGQTGVDIAALRAGAAAGIKTGGFCPKGWLTELGPRPDLLKSFGLAQHDLTKYPPRTRANVVAGDCTLIIADHMDTGSKFTAEICFVLERPMLHLTRSKMESDREKALDEVLGWLRSVPHGIVNVAGNRESKSPGIEAEAEVFLTSLFKEAIKTL